jgi:hypothetical protein
LNFEMKKKIEKKVKQILKKLRQILGSCQWDQEGPKVRPLAI